MIARPCIVADCPRMAVGGPRGARCVPCQRAYDRTRNAQPSRAPYRDTAYRSVPLSGRCVDCGTTEDLTRDHVVELADGGTNDATNIVIRCRSCNSSKSNQRRREARKVTDRDESG